MGAAFRDPELLVKRIISWIQSELRRADAKDAVFGSRLCGYSGASPAKAGFRRCSLLCRAKASLRVCMIESHSPGGTNRRNETGCQV